MVILTAQVPAETAKQTWGKMWNIIPHHGREDEMLHFFTLNTAPLGVIEKRVKL